MFFPVDTAKEYKLWQIREVEQVSNKGTHVLIKWKKFDALDEKKKVIDYLKTDISEDECITAKMIPLSVVQGSVESFRLILEAVYPRKTNFLIL